MPSLLRQPATPLDKHETPFPSHPRTLHIPRLVTPSHSRSESRTLRIIRQSEVPLVRSHSGPPSTPSGVAASRPRHRLSPFLSLFTPRFASSRLLSLSDKVVVSWAEAAAGLRRWRARSASLTGERYRRSPSPTEFPDRGSPPAPSVSTPSHPPTNEIIVHKVNNRRTEQEGNRVYTGWTLATRKPSSFREDFITQIC